MSVNYDIDDMIAAGQIEISGNAGWAPTGTPQLVTSGADDLSALLAAAAGFGGGGDELDGISAGAGNSSRQMNPAMQNAIAQRMVNSGLMVTREKPTKAREFPLGFESPLAVPNGNTATITSRPQIPFRGERLIVPSDIAGSFSILDLRVGKNSQFTSSGAVPARTFQENAVGIRLMLDTAQISQDVTLSVQNVGGAPQTFRAALIGSAVE